MLLLRHFIGVWLEHGVFGCFQEFSAAALTPELLSDLMKCMSFGEFKGGLAVWLVCWLFSRLV